MPLITLLLSKYYIISELNLHNCLPFQKKQNKQKKPHLFQLQNTTAERRRSSPVPQRLVARALPRSRGPHGPVTVRGCPQAPARPRGEVHSTERSGAPAAPYLGLPVCTAVAVPSPPSPTRRPSRRELHTPPPLGTLPPTGCTRPLPRE